MGNAAKILMLLVCCGSGAAMAVYVASTLGIADRPAVDGGADSSAADAATIQDEVAQDVTARIAETHAGVLQTGAANSASNAAPQGAKAQPAEFPKSRQPGPFTASDANPVPQDAAESAVAGAALAAAVIHHSDRPAAAFDAAERGTPTSRPGLLRPVAAVPELLPVETGGSNRPAVLPHSGNADNLVGVSPSAMKRDAGNTAATLNAPDNQRQPAHGGGFSRRQQGRPGASDRSEGRRQHSNHEVARANQPHTIVRPRLHSNAAVVPAVSQQPTNDARPQADGSSARSDVNVRPAATEPGPATAASINDSTLPSGTQLAQGGLPIPALPEGLSGELGNLLRAAQELSGNSANPTGGGNNSQPPNIGGASGASPRPGNSQPQPRANESRSSGGKSELSIRRTEDLPVPPPGAGRPPMGPAEPPAHQGAPGTAVVGEGDEHLEIYARNQEIRDVLALLGEQAGLNIVATRSVAGQVSVSLSNVSVDGALEAVLRSTGYIARREGRFIYVGTPADFAEMETAYDRIGTRVFRPYYVSATELQALITPLMTPNIGKVSVNTPPAVGIGTNDNEAGGDSFSGGDTLLVQDRETVLREIEQVVREVDRAPMQVAIEAMILSVTLGDKYECGVDFQFLRNQGTIRFGIGSPAASVDGVDFEAGGLKFAYLDSSLGAFIKALETVGDTSVIATPRVMVLNKQRAEVLIGGQLGYVNTTVTETTATQSVEFLEVGTQLRIRPFISPDGMIRMEVHPELSTGAVRIEQGLTLPDKQVTKVTSNVMVRDGSTVIIGGLMRDDLKNDAKQMPLMGSLPLLGKLFRTSVEETTRTEIVVLLTPRIVQQDELAIDGDRAACEFHRRHQIQADNMSDFSRDHLSDKYCRLATQAYRQGERERAWRYIQLAVEIKPGNRKAIELRSRMAAGVAPHLLDGPAPSEPGLAPGEREPMTLEAGAEEHIIVPDGVLPYGAEPQLHGPRPEGPHLHEPARPGMPLPQPGGPQHVTPAYSRRAQPPRQASHQASASAQASMATARPNDSNAAPAPGRGIRGDSMQSRGSGNRTADPGVMPAWMLDELRE